MLRFTFLVGAFILSTLAASSQTLSIKGTLRDTADKIAVSGATIRLSVQADTNTRFNAVSDRAGVFEFGNLAPQTYILRISSVGYETIEQTIVLQDSSRDLGVLIVPRQAKLLSEVTVRVQLPPVRQKTDTLEYSANAFKVNPDANAEDMMKKMPGVTVDRGTVTAQGEQVRKVTIDGRDFFGDDATAALRNLPAEVIDKIQVFDRLSDQAQFTGVDDGNAVKAINIVTKADMRNGQFGRVYAGYGTDDRYSAGGNMTFFNGTRRISVVGQTNNINQQNFATQDLLGVTSNVNRGGGNRGGGGGGGQRPGGGGGNFGGGGNWGGGQGNFMVGQQPGISKTNALGINFSDKWGKDFEVTGSYFFNHSNNLNNERTNREYFLPGDSSQFYRENSTTSSNNYNHRLNMRMEYRIDSSNSLIFQPRVRFQKNEAAGSFTSDLNNPTVPVSTATASDRALSNGYNIEGDLLWRHAFAKPGRTLSVNIEAEWDRDNGDTYIEQINRYFKGGNTWLNDSLQQHIDEFSNGFNLETNVSYTEPIGKKGQLQFTYRPSWSINKADQATYHFDAGLGKYSIFDDSLSNKLDNTYNTQNGGINYRIGDRDNSFSVGLNYQYAVLEGEQVFPYVTA
ncbi:MAG TPA: TonB-dependent receptor, partial [Chitinophagaceae bacterium]|nr:TonB-dependent receptor [Chitinophagaceae bacterium]